MSCPPVRLDCRLVVKTVPTIWVPAGVPPGMLYPHWRYLPEKARGAGPGIAVDSIDIHPTAQAWPAGTAWKTASGDLDKVNALGIVPGSCGGLNHGLLDIKIKGLSDHTRQPAVVHDFPPVAANPHLRNFTPECKRPAILLRATDDAYPDITWEVGTGVRRVNLEP